MRQNHPVTRFLQAPSIRRTRQLASPRQWYRQLTARRRPLPEFIIAGAQKAGTTSLFDYLAQHPQCAASFTKEVHYFDEAFDRGEGWYRMHFPLSSTATDKKCFESSPYYMFDPRVPARIRAALPHAKLIFLLRNPVSRAYSHYQHSVRRGREVLSFSAALDAESVRLAGERERLLADPTAHSAAHRHYSYATRGYYAEQLREWLRHFPRQQILFLQSEVLFKQPQQAFAAVLEFLELDPWAPRQFGSHNTGRYQEPMPEADRGRLARQFAEPNAELFELIGERYDWRA